MPFQATVVQKKLEEAGFETKLAYGIESVLETDVVGELEGLSLKTTWTLNSPSSTPGSPSSRWT